MPTTTATTTLADAVRRRICELHDRGVRTLTPGHFEDVAREFGKPAAWVLDILLVLQGTGVLVPVRRPGPRAWTVAPGAEFLR